MKLIKTLLIAGSVLAATAGAALAESGTVYDDNGNPAYRWSATTATLGNGNYRHRLVLRPLAYHVYFSNVICNRSQSYWANVFRANGNFTFSYLDGSPSGNWHEDFIVN